MNNTYLAAIDFDPGMHGHFLEYICNKYIFNTPAPTLPFFKSGSSHGINSDTNYQQHKYVTSGHYTYSKTPVNINKVVYIKHNPKFDLVLLSNVIHRCYGSLGNHEDVDPNQILNWHLDIIKNDNATEEASILKENIYSKLIERTYFQPTNVTHFYKSEIFNFDFGNFFNLTDFLIELQNLANFFNQTLIVPPDLVDDWKMFIDKNQGYQVHQRVNFLLEKILTNQTETIEDNFLIHAGINVYLSRIARLHDTELHTINSYPTTTEQVYKILTNHFIEHDKKY
jgi:hypothetical protein